jgi:hypothetical protein
MDMPMQMLQQMTLFPEPARDWARKQRRVSRGGAEARRDGRGRHEHSLAAHDAVDHALTGRRAEIVAWLNLHGPATDREIVEGLFYAGADMNLVRPRVSELLDSQDLAEAGRVLDSVTRMMVRRVAVAAKNAENTKKEVES